MYLIVGAGLGESEMAAVNFHGRTPWAIALTVLFLIWTVKFLQTPAVSHVWALTQAFYKRRKLTIE